MFHRPPRWPRIGALDDHEFRAATIAMNDEGKAYLEAAFTRLGLFAYPSAANFIAVRVPVAAETAYDDLLRRGIIVRSGDKLRHAEFLTHHDRIAPKKIARSLPHWKRSCRSGGERAQVPA